MSWWLMQAQSYLVQLRASGGDKNTCMMNFILEEPTIYIPNFFPIPHLM